MSASGLNEAELLVVGLLLVLVTAGVLAMARRPAQAQASSMPPLGGTLEQQMAEWDRRLATVPQHADLRSISDRLHAVERTCDVVRAEVGGMKDAVARVERMTNMLLEQQLGEK